MSLPIISSSFLSTREFVSLHDTRSATDMQKIDLVYQTINAVNALTGSKLKVEIQFTDGVFVVPAEKAHYAEVVIVKE